MKHRTASCSAMLHWLHSDNAWPQSCADPCNIHHFFTAPDSPWGTATNYCKIRLVLCCGPDVSCNPVKAVTVHSTRTQLQKKDRKTLWFALAGRNIIQVVRMKGSYAQALHYSAVTRYWIIVTLPSHAPCSWRSSLWSIFNALDANYPVHILWYVHSWYFATNRKKC